MWGQNPWGGYGAKATWSVQDGVLVGLGGMGHIYTEARCSDFEAKELYYMDLSK